jgi:hypothetical protein
LQPDIARISGSTTVSCNQGYSEFGKTAELDIRQRRGVRDEKAIQFGLDHGDQYDGFCGGGNDV